MERPTFLDLEPRPAKPRSIGLTAALDGGLPIDEVRAILHAHAGFLDLWKLGWGSAYLDPHLDSKLDLLHRADVVEALLDEIGPERLLFEAPRKEQQAWFINHVGAEVNLSNVAPREAMGVEALRLGLRADTTASALLRRITLRS